MGIEAYFSTDLATDLSNHLLSLNWQFLLLFLTDINELNLPKTCEIDFSDQDDLLNFKLVICPDEVSDVHATAYCAI